MMNKLLLILATAFLLTSCNSGNTVSDGEGSSTEVVIGLIVDSTGELVEGAVVSLYPNDYNPVNDSGKGKITDTTKKSGTFLFNIEKPDSYTIICESENSTSSKFGAMKAYTSPSDPDTTFDTIEVALLVEKTVAIPDSAVDTVGGYIYIPGTDYIVPVDSAQKSDGFFNFTFNAIPQGDIGSIKYGTKGDSDTEVIIDDEVKIFEPFWYSLSPEGIDPLNNAGAIIQDSSGSIWFANGFLLSRVDTNNQWSQFDTTSAGVKGLLFDLAADMDKGIWVVQDMKYISYFDGTNWTVYDSTVFNPISNVRTVTAVTKDTVWFGNEYGKGAFKYIKSTGTWVSETIAGGPNENNIVCLAHRSGKVWAARSNGSAVYSGGSWTTYSLADMKITEGAPKYVDIMDNGDVWISTNFGLSHFNGSDWAFYDSSNSGLDKKDLFEINHDKEGRIYVSSSKGGVSSLYGGVWKNHSVDAGTPPSNLHTIYSVMIDRDGNLWASGKGAFVMGPTAEKYSK